MKVVKRKDKKDTSRTDVSAQGNEYKIEGNIEKSKTGEKGRASNFLKHADGNEESLYFGFEIDVELLKGKELEAREEDHSKKKKKKKKKKKNAHDAYVLPNEAKDKMA
ncbi:unnamed protein product [Amaranthus hypochondriacus]